MGGTGGAHTLNGTDSTRANRPGAVVWAGRCEGVEQPCEGDPALASLVKSLSKHGVEPVVVETHLQAMAQACLLGPGSLLVLCNPGAHGCAAAQLVCALRKYAGAVVVYVFEPQAAESLRAVCDQDLVDWGAPGTAAEPTHTPPPRSNGKPALRLAGVGGGASEGPRPIGPSLPITEHNGTTAEHGAEVLSADELAMLLGRNGPIDKGTGARNAKGDQR